MNARLAGKAALVVGGASGLGAAIARCFAEVGARTTVADIDGERAETVCREIVDAGGDAIACRADATRAADVAAMVDAACVDDVLHVLVLSLAVETRSSVTECSDEEWQRVLDVNVKAPFLCMQRALPRMVAAGRGSIIALGSVLGSIVAPQYAAYCTSKGALVNLCKQAAIESAADGVRVNVIAPGACEAGLFLEVTAQAPDPVALRASIAEQVPMRRLGSAADVVEAALFLASDASAYISGAVLPLDGGLAARRMS